MLSDGDITTTAEATQAGVGCDSLPEVLWRARGNMAQAMWGRRV